MKYKPPKKEVKEKNNEIYYSNIVNIESLFSTFKTIVSIPLLVPMFEYWDYPLIPVAIILFILTTIFSFSHLMYIIFYIKIENDALPAFNNIIEGLKKNAEMNDKKTNKFVFLIKLIIFFTMKSFGVLANLTFISAMILILIAIIISM